MLENLKNIIASVVKTNGNEEITGANLQSTLFRMTDELAKIGYKGNATPTTMPVVGDGPMFYLTAISGTYPRMGGLVVNKEIAALIYSGTSWSKQTLIRIDDVPTDGSTNLITSGGVASATSVLTYEQQQAINSGITAALVLEFMDKQDKVDPNIAIREGLTSVVGAINQNNENTYDDEIKAYYSWDSYTICREDEWNTDANPLLNITNIQGTQYDAARMILGGDWCIPTLVQIQELAANCSITTLYNDPAPAPIGYKFTSNINGASITIPILYLWWNGTSPFATAIEGAAGITSSEWSIAIDGTPVVDHLGWAGIPVFAGTYIRPVSHTYGIDLGLPSGTRWADANLIEGGFADTNLSYGDFFAFGETFTKYAYVPESRHKDNRSKHITQRERAIWNGKQNKLTAGSGITIEDDVINSEVEYINQEPEWLLQTWSGYTNVGRGGIWKDYNGVAHYDNGSNHYYLDSDSKTWLAQTWKGYAIDFPNYLWADYNGVIHYNSGYKYYYLDSDCVTWKQQTWSGFIPDRGQYTWTDNNGVIHYDNGSNHYYLDSDNTTWIEQTWNGYTSIDGQYIWKDYNGVIHYDNQSAHYYLDSDGETWLEQTWPGYEPLMGNAIWTDNDGIIHYDINKNHYDLDSDCVTWKSQTWNGSTNIDGRYVWTDNDGIVHYDSGSTHYYLLDANKGYFTAHNDELQVKLAAGDNITIENNVISASVGAHTHPEYQPLLAAGRGITIADNNISQTTRSYGTNTELSSYWIKIAETRIKLTNASSDFLLFFALSFDSAKEQNALVHVRIRTNASGVNSSSWITTYGGSELDDKIRVYHSGTEKAELWLRVRARYCFAHCAEIYNGFRGGDAYATVSTNSGPSWVWLDSKNITAEETPTYTDYISSQDYFAQTYQPLLSAGEGISVNNGVISSNNNCAWGTCADDKSVLNKVAATSNPIKLAAGVRVYVQFTSTSGTAPTSGNMTLNVDGTGAKAIYRNGVTGTSRTRMTYSHIAYFAASKVIEFIYDGTYWNIIG